MSVNQMSTKTIQKLFKTICLEVGSAQKNGSGNFKNKYATLEEIQETLAIVLEKHKDAFDKLLVLQINLEHFDNKIISKKDSIQKSGFDKLSTCN